MRHEQPRSGLFGAPDKGRLDTGESELDGRLHGFDRTSEGGAVSRLAWEPAEHDDGGGGRKRGAGSDGKLDATDERVLRRLRQGSPGWSTQAGPG
jgi:hypothetical protein